MEKEKAVMKSSLERLAVFIDIGSLESSLKNDGVQVDVLALRDYLSEGRLLLESFCYLGFRRDDPRENEDQQRFLRMNGFIVRSKPAKVMDGAFGGDFAIELTLDVVDYVSQVEPEIVVLVTGNGSFAPLATWARRKGVRVEVASAPHNLSQDLREAASDHIDLYQAIEEIRGREEQLSAPRKEGKTDGSGDHQRQEGGDPVHHHG